LLDHGPGPRSDLRRHGEQVAVFSAETPLVLAAAIMHAREFLHAAAGTAAAVWKASGYAHQL